MPESHAAEPTPPVRVPPVTPEQILRWAREHHARAGDWPSTRTAGVIPGTAGERWKNLDQALRCGGRGLPGGSSLARLLEAGCGVRNRNRPPPLAVDQVLAWADQHHARTGRWPAATSGPIPGAGGETWGAVAAALEAGVRGLPGGSSLPRLLAEQRGHRHPGLVAPLTDAQILAWADAHFRRTGSWPTKRCADAIPEAPGEGWTALDQALRAGKRGLPGGSSLARLLAQARGLRNRGSLPPLAEGQILRWADSYFRRHGRWPAEADGPVPRSGGETWSGVDQALNVGLRGLPGGSSLARLLARERGHRHSRNRPALSYCQVLKWADAHRERTGRWPTTESGAVEGAPGERWEAVDRSLRQGWRGLPGGTSLVCLLAEARGAAHHHHPARLSVARVLAWADAHRDRHGRWPRPEAGPVAEGESVSWRVVHDCLRRGERGLPGPTTLTRFLAEHDRGGP